MHPILKLTLVLAGALAVAISGRIAPLHAGDASVVPKDFDLTQNWQIPAAGDLPTALPSSAASNGAITLTATKGLATSCVYSPLIDLAAPLTARPDTITGPAKGRAGMDFVASQASGTVTVSVTALYGVSPSNVTTFSDQSGGSGTYTGTMGLYAAGQTTTTAMRIYTEHIPRSARYMRFLLVNNGGVALTIPAGGWRYFSP